MAQDFRHFGEFWPYYLGEHAKPTTRALHFLGTGSGLCLLALSLASGDFALLPIAVVCGYAPAWIGHFFIEKNRPATFRHPFWSLRGDFRMFFLFLTGRLGQELRRLGIR